MLIRGRSSVLIVVIGGFLLWGLSDLPLSRHRLLGRGRVRSAAQPETYNTNPRKQTGQSKIPSRRIRAPMRPPTIERREFQRGGLNAPDSAQLRWAWPTRRSEGSPGSEWPG